MAATRKPKGLQLIEERHGPFPEAYARLKREGFSDAQIAAHFNTCPTTLADYRKRTGVSLKRQPPLVSVSE